MVTVAKGVAQKWIDVLRLQRYLQTRSVGPVIGCRQVVKKRVKLRMIA